MLLLVIRSVRVRLAAGAGQSGCWDDFHKYWHDRACVWCYICGQTSPPPTSEVSRGSITLWSFQFIPRVLCLPPPRRRTDRSHGFPSLWTSRSSIWQNKGIDRIVLTSSLGQRKDPGVSFELQTWATNILYILGLQRNIQLFTNKLEGHIWLYIYYGIKKSQSDWYKSH